MTNTALSAKAKQIAQNVTFKENLEAPINKGDVVGTVTYTLDDDVIKTINILASDDVRKINLINMSMSVYESWFKVLRK